MTRNEEHWFIIETLLYPVIGNVGGHGTHDCNNEYTRILITEFNIKIIHQVPRLLYTNVLDLGVREGLQDAVEQRNFMKRCNAESLVRIAHPLYRWYIFYTYLNNTNYINIQYGYLLKPRFSLRILPLGDTAKIIEVVKYYIRRQDLHYLLLSNIKTITATNKNNSSPHHCHHNILYD